LFANHAIGESASTWALEEGGQEIDPLSKCQQMIWSQLIEQSLDSAKKCREFVDQGSYAIQVRGREEVQKVFLFRRWRLSTIVIRFDEAERRRIAADFNSRFAVRVPNQSWQSADGDFVEIRPVNDLEFFVGSPSHDSGFIVVVSPIESLGP